MKNLLAIAIVMLFAAYIAQADYCNASATGTFTFQVEQAIGLTGNLQQTIELGGICPGCEKTFREACAAWTVTGGPDCYFHAAMTGPGTNFPADITINGGWEASLNGGAWGALNASGNYAINQNVAIRVCINSIITTCNDIAGNYSLVYGLNVNYICSLQ
jgi:hypothetical protein